MNLPRYSLQPSTDCQSLKRETCYTLASNHSTQAPEFTTKYLTHPLAIEVHGGTAGLTLWGVP